MKSKRIVSTIMLMLLMMTLCVPMEVAAYESVTVEVTFTVENTPGTVVIEAVGKEPLPAVTELSDVLEGSFAITYAEPGDYFYRVYQKQGLEDYTAYYEKYDDTVYDVEVSVFIDKNGELYGVVTASIPGDSHKPDGVVFTNESEKAALSITKDQAKGTEKRTKDVLEVEPGDNITYYITVSNNTEGSVYDVTVTDVIPEGLTLVEGTISNDGSEEEREITWYIGVMGPGDTATVSFTTKVPDVTKATTWDNIAKGSFINQTGRVEISTETQPMAATPPTGRAASEPDVIELNTNLVKAVYTPPVTPPPKTGDIISIGLWIVLGAASLTGIIFLVLTRRKESD